MIDINYKFPYCEAFSAPHIISFPPKYSPQDYVLKYL